MKLIGSLTSPFARKVRIVMAEKKLDYQLELDNVWAADAKTPQFNPLGQVPTLVMEDGGALFDSRVIVEYLDTLSPVARLLPQNGRERASAKCWEALADGVLDACVLIFRESMRPAVQQSQEWTDRQRGKIHSSLTAMNASLGESAFCLGANYSLADIAVGCVLGYLDLRFTQIDWRQDHPNLARLYKKLADRASFKDTAPPVA